VKAASPFFARIQNDVFAILKSVPKGALVTFRAIGVHLDVVPRHVAYILAMPDVALLHDVPWHRAVPDDGILKTPKTHGGVTQRALLLKEGLAISEKGEILDLAKRVLAVDSLKHKVAKQTRPADAPNRTSTRSTAKRAATRSRVSKG
jgi:methylated-DNA-protein-cysteine methyltransferase related protein